MTPGDKVGGPGSWGGGCRGGEAQLWLPWGTVSREVLKSGSWQASEGLSGQIPTLPWNLIGEEIGTSGKVWGNSQPQCMSCWFGQLLLYSYLDIL